MNSSLDIGGAKDTVFAVLGAAVDSLPSYLLIFDALPSADCVTDTLFPPGA